MPKSPFKLATPFEPAGDQPKAISALTNGLAKGFDRQTLLGVTGSGKSVTYDTPVLIRHKGLISLKKIGDVIDKVLAKNSENIQVHNDSEIIENDKCDIGVEVFSFDPIQKASEWKPILQYVRHLSPETLFVITTTCGRSVTVTGDHSVYVLRNGLLTLVHTNEIRISDYIPTPRILPGPSKPRTSIDISKYISSNEKWYVSMPFFKESYQNARQHFVSSLGRAKSFSVAHYGERVTSSIFHDMAMEHPSLLKNATIGSRSIKYQFPMTVQLVPTVLRFFGLYIAEGHAEKNYVTISSADEAIIHDFSVFSRYMGVDVVHRKNSYDYQISSKVLTNVLHNICGKDSQTKKLPNFWPELSNPDLAHLLSGYFAGDGGVDGVQITATTSSYQLASDILYALKRFGINARCREKFVKIPNKNMSNMYWMISISGQKDLEIFKNEIGFKLARKDYRLMRITGRTYNTNVDLIPISGEKLRQFRSHIGMTQNELANMACLERSYISMLESGVRKPSLETYTRLLVVFKKKINDSGVMDSGQHKQIQEMESLLNLFWTPVKSVIKVKGEKYVYDFAVQDNETFLAGHGGVFVHNTFTAANVIAQYGKPTLVIAHNKTLAAQLAQEYREFFPNNAVHYFVSYYDYYQPEAYIPSSDTYIEKEAMINEEIERLRHASTQALLTRKDVIIVASVSCIYGLGSPEEYEKVNLKLKVGMELSRAELIRKLINIHFERTTADLKSGQFRAIGNTIEIMPVNDKTIYRLEYGGETSGCSTSITIITELDPVSRSVRGTHETVFIFPAKHFISSDEQSARAYKTIQAELVDRLKVLKKAGKLLEEERLKRRVKYDLSMIKEIGYTNGIENYSRHFSGKMPGEPPDSLLSYFPHKKDPKTGKVVADFLTIIDESHVTIPQLNGMYAGDFSRKDTLVEHGFRLPSAKDNRPLKFNEFLERVGPIIYTSATPGKYEAETNNQVVEQVIRPTGLVDPVVEIRPIREKGKYLGQIFDFIAEAEKTIAKGDRVLATTLTKKMAEDLSEFLKEKNIKASYLHSDVKTIERINILTDFRKGKYDILVGVNLLREGLDLPEVSLIGILDADKEGFLRSETALIQTIGRAARNAAGRVILYADNLTGSMNRAIKETNRRRAIQVAYNTKHGITPQTIIKAIHDITDQLRTEHDKAVNELVKIDEELARTNPKLLMKQKQAAMEEAVKMLDFETAALIRDELIAIEAKFAKEKKVEGKKL